MSTAATVLSSFSVKNGISDICRFRRVILSPDNTEVKLLWKFLPATYGRVLSLLLLLCPVTDISATVAPIGVKFYMMVHIGPGQVFSLFGNGTSREPKFQNFGPKFWLLNREYLENGKSKRRMSIITPARLQLSKNVQHGTVAPREKGKYVFLPKDRCLAPIGVKICTMVGADIFRGLQIASQKCFWTIYVWLQIYRRQSHWSGWNSAWWYTSVFSPFEAVPPGEPRNPKVWLSEKPNISKNVKSQRYMSIRA